MECKPVVGLALTNYFINQFENLKAYCEDGRLPISNIETEHVAKIIAVARKKFLFANTSFGAKTSAKIYSMIITAVANGLEPTRYLNYILTGLSKIKKINLWSICRRGA